MSITSWVLTWLPRGRRELTMFVAGLFLFASGVAFNELYAPTHGQDFAAWYYPVAERFVAGQNIYVLSGDVLRLDEARRGTLPPVHILADAYPPLHAALLVPLVPFGRPLAQYVFLVISLAVFSFGLWRLLSITTPWTIAGRTLAIGVAMWASSVRWSSLQYQLSLSAVGLVCLAMYFELRGRRLATALSMVLCVKFTMLIPIVGVLLFRRRIATLVTTAVVTAVLNFACFVWMGLKESIAGYWLNVNNYVVINGLNYPSVQTLLARLSGDAALAVQPPGIILGPVYDFYYYPEHTQWTLLLTAFTRSFETAQLVAWVLVAIAGFALLLLGLRYWNQADDPEVGVRWFMLLSCFGLVATTHLKYDLIILVPVCYLAIGLPTRSVWDRVLAVSSFIVAFTLTARFATLWIFRVAIPLGAAWLIPYYVFLATLVLIFAVLQFAALPVKTDFVSELASTHQQDYLIRKRST